MADVLPFRGLRYRLAGVDLASVVAPPYDVIEETARQRLLEMNDHNIVTVDIAADGYEAAAARWRSWQQSGVIVQERQPALYAYKQTFDGPDGTVTTRFGVMGAVKLAAYDERVVFPHERTLTGPKVDRLHLMRTTRAQLSPVFGLHFGAAASIEALLEAACGGAKDAAGPDMIVTDHDGVRHEMWVLTDPELLRTVTEALRPARIVIADGHHRYETALAFRDEQRQGGGPNDGAAAWNYVQMMLVDIGAPGLTVFPTHRIISSLAGVNPAEVEAVLGEAFVLEKLSVNDNAEAAAEQALDRLGETPGFVLYSGGAELWSARLRDQDAWDTLAADRPAAWRSLDVAVLHALALPRLGLDDKRQSSGEYMTYARTAEEALQTVRRGAGATALLVRPTPSAAVRDVALAGHNMPQKSTYYYPKLLTGLVMSDLDTPVGL